MTSHLEIENSRLADEIISLQEVLGALATAVSDESMLAIFGDRYRHELEWAHIMLCPERQATAAEEWPAEYAQRRRKDLADRRAADRRRQL